MLSNRHFTMTPDPGTSSLHPLVTETCSLVSLTTCYVPRVRTTASICYKQRCQAYQGNKRGNRNFDASRRVRVAPRIGRVVLSLQQVFFRNSLDKNITVVREWVGTLFQEIMHFLDLMVLVGNNLQQDPFQHAIRVGGIRQVRA